MGEPLNLALTLTLGRIVLSPIFLLFYLFYAELGVSLKVLPFVLIFLVGLAELSDLLDGMAARKKNQVTELGKILDPMADSIFRLSVFLTFTQGIVMLPLWLVLFFFYRDSIISMLRTICALRGFTLAARLSGKVKAVVQCCASFMILGLMIPYAFGYLSLSLFREISLYIAAGAVTYSVFSGVEYLYANQQYIKKAIVKS